MTFSEITDFTVVKLMCTPRLSMPKETSESQIFKLSSSVFMNLLLNRYRLQKSITEHSEHILCRGQWKEAARLVHKPANH